LGIKEIRIVKEPSGRSKGFGYIEFQERDGLAKALMSDNTPYKGRNLNVDVEKSRAGVNGGRQKPEWGPSKEGGRSSYSRDNYGGRSGGRGGGGGGGGRYGPPQTQYRGDSPGGERPKLNIKPKSAQPESSSPPVAERTKLSEDPFGGAADDLQKLDLQQKKMMERQQEIERSKEEKLQKEREKDKDEKTKQPVAPNKPYPPDSWRSKNSNPASRPTRGGGNFRTGERDNYGRGEYRENRGGGGGEYRENRGGGGGEYREHRGGGGGEFREHRGGGGEFREQRGDQQRGGEFREQRDHRSAAPRRPAPDSYRDLPGAGRGRKTEVPEQSHQKSKGKELPQGNRFDLLRSDGPDGADGADGDDNENDNEESSK